MGLILKVIGATDLESVPYGEFCEEADSLWGILGTSVGILGA